MTLERQRWWNGLSANEKYLRKEISILKSRRSEEKHHASTTWSSIVKKTAVTRINRYTAHIRALKHELDRTTKKVAYKSYNGLTNSRCEKCGGTFENFGQSYCCWCGRKIVGCKSNE